MTEICCQRNIHCNRFGKWVLQESNKENYCLIILSTGENEKHNTLIRYDIIQGLKQLYDELGDNHIKQIAMELLKLEEDSKYRNKYQSGLNK
ncbi:hypothetical protein ACUXCC_001116 [Cytobacillus horneckiae]|uniref:hypothetical protein n=1 Tax=Cytobacillus horneckiae TaxID=549687 RepID=UPI001F14D850|nr:hypothetical protein [Cytobacillus horneckiae]MCM3176682.1 hypothetical protein [Cytobacillus horneckiae]MEC1158483.1 hypothetical protein [Cytobacillus horneckiae]MED2939586.1 hypothetical protein [Cytobacillus horneckiae]